MPSWTSVFQFLLELIGALPQAEFISQLFLSSLMDSDFINASVSYYKQFGLSIVQWSKMSYLISEFSHRDTTCATAQMIPQCLISKFPLSYTSKGFLSLSFLYFPLKTKPNLLSLRFLCLFLRVASFFFLPWSWDSSLSPSYQEPWAWKFHRCTEDKNFPLKSLPLSSVSSLLLPWTALKLLPTGQLQMLLMEFPTSPSLCILDCSEVARWFDISDSSKAAHPFRSPRWSHRTPAETNRQTDIPHQPACPVIILGILGPHTDAPISGGSSNKKIVGHHLPSTKVWNVRSQGNPGQ